MKDRATHVYIKPVTWAGKTHFYLGLQASRPQAEPYQRLRGWFSVFDRLDQARAAAQAEADRLGCRSVIECENYIGL